MSNSEPYVPDLTPSKSPVSPIVREQIINGVRYVYEDYPYWDKDKKQTRHKRIYLGHYNAQGVFIKSKSYQNKERVIVTSDEDINNKSEYKFVGATYLLDQIANKTGLAEDLKIIFPNNYKQILSLSYYLTLENDNPYYRFKKWSKLHLHPHIADIPSQRVSELLSTITENDKLELFKCQTKRLQAKECLAYDTTSISSYSDNILQAKYGLNKDGDKLPQINLALVVGEESLLPAYYRILPGNINDFTTLNKLLIDIKFLEIKDYKFIMDKGFYCSENIQKLYSEGINYIVGIKNNIAFVANKMQELNISNFNISNYSVTHDVYYNSFDVFVPLKKHINNFNISNIQKVKSFLHIYYDANRANSELCTFNQKIILSIQKIKDKVASKADFDIINKYCSLDYNDKNDSYNINYNFDAINDVKNKFGFFSLLTNLKLSSIEILDIYRNKDIIEKSFNNLKNRLNLRRTNVHSYQNLEGEIFLQYISLTFLLYIHKHMKDNGLYKNFTMETLFDELDIIAQFKYSNTCLYFNEITKKQLELYKYMDVTPII
jgi:transposase